MNIPNLLSAFRLLLVPVFIFIYFQDHAVALTVFALASATDILDGYIARKFEMTTKLGAILDPVADKLMQLSVLGCLFWSGLFPLWALAILLVKELLMTIGTLVALKKGIAVYANVFGKAATVIIAICIITILFFGRYTGAYINLLAVIASLASLCAFVSYIISFKQTIKKPE